MLKPAGRRLAALTVDRAKSFSRRELLQRSLGIAVLAAAPDFLSVEGANAAGVGMDTRAAGHFFLYGVPDPSDNPGPSVHVGSSPGAGDASPNVVATQLAALPVKSRDETKLALVAVEESAGAAGITVTIVDVQSAETISTGTLTMRGEPDALLLITPVFAGDSATLALVLSITVPKNWRTASKLDLVTGDTQIVRTATWVSHHALAYFDSRTNAFDGPFHLSDGPSLARVSIAANDNDLFVWTVDEAAAVLVANKNAVPVPRVSAFPVGSGIARFSVEASEVWPVNGEPVAILSNGQIARLVNGRQVEIYSPEDGSHTTVTLSSLDQGSAKPAAPIMQVRTDGLVFIANPAIGQAVLADPAQTFKAVSSISYSPPADAGGAPVSKAIWSSDGTSLYTLASSDGGLLAYDGTSGALRASHSSGKRYSAVYELRSKTILAVSPDHPRLSFFNPSLDPIATADTDLNLVEVY